jgi:hypothetical protein
MTQVTQFLPMDDRKALEVIQGVLAYAARELSFLRAPQAELAAAVSNALQVSSTVLGEDGSGGEVSLHRAATAFE